MKKTIALMSVVLSASLFSNAQAADSSAAKRDMSSEIAAKVQAFLEITKADEKAVAAANSSPKQALRSMDERDESLQAIATEIWQLRAQMMDQKCVEADSFQF